MKKLLIVGLLVTVLIGIVVSGTVLAFNPQPEPPGRVANKIASLTNQLNELQTQLSQVLAEPWDDMPVDQRPADQLRLLRDAAQNIVNTAEEMLP